MFLGAVGAPFKGFDGKLGLWPIGDEVEAKRKSKYFVKGAKKFVPGTMGKDLFFSMLQDNVAKEAIARAPASVTDIEIQFDNAGGHGGKHGIKSLLEEFNKWGAKCFPRVTAIAQPAKSPDFNALDLGAWNSLVSRVVEVKHEKNASKR